MVGRLVDEVLRNGLQVSVNRSSEDEGFTFDIQVNKNTKYNVYGKIYYKMRYSL